MSREKNFLTVKEAARELGLSVSTLYKMVLKKEIPFYKPNGKILYFKREELMDWIEQSKVPSHED